MGGGVCGALPDPLGRGWVGWVGFCRGPSKDAPRFLKAGLAFGAGGCTSKLDGTRSQELPDPQKGVLPQCWVDVGGGANIQILAVK